jgi:hypothetical protein
MLNDFNHEALNQDAVLNMTFDEIKLYSAPQFVQITYVILSNIHRRAVKRNQDYFQPLNTALLRSSPLPL